MSELPPLGPTPVLKAEAGRVRGHGGSVMEILYREATIPQHTLMFCGLPLSSVKRDPNSLMFLTPYFTGTAPWFPLCNPPFMCSSKI